MANWRKYIYSDVYVLIYHCKGRNTLKRLFIILILISLIFLISCTNDKMPSGTLSPEPVENTESPQAMVSSEPTAAPTAAPVPFEPAEFIKGTYELKDDTKRLYIDVEYIDPYAFDTGTVERIFTTAVKKDMDDMIEWIKASALEYPATDENMVSYGLSSFLVITRNEEDFLSAYVDYHTYTGGAHGNLTRIPYVYDRNGFRYEALQDILSEGITVENAETEVNRLMKEIIEEQGSMFYEDSIAFDELYSPPGFYIKDGKLGMVCRRRKISRNSKKKHLRE